MDGAIQGMLILIAMIAIFINGWFGPATCLRRGAWLLRSSFDLLMVIVVVIAAVSAKCLDLLERATNRAALRLERTADAMHDRHIEEYRRARG